jgi:RHS repeat-associated protein
MLLAGDAWGYPLEGRTYNADSMKFKYTGKELDKESLYDYFGARYYDSRIGRWGQTEPLLEKYLSISPYSYAICNPLKYNDINGKDARFSINAKNRTIDIDITLNYTLNGELGLDENQFLVLEQLQKNAQELWTGFFKINGVLYNVTTTVTLQSFKDYSTAAYETQQNLGQNTVKNYQIGDKLESNLGIGADAAVLFLQSGSALNPRDDSGAHEIGHLLGLPDILLSDSKSIMSYAVDRNPPQSQDFGSINILRNLNLSITGSQYVKGNSND